MTGKGLNATSFKLDDESLELLDLLAKKGATTRTGIIKQIIRRAAKVEGIQAGMPTDDAIRAGLDARANRDGLKPKADQR